MRAISDPQLIAKNQSTNHKSIALLIIKQHKYYNYYNIERRLTWTPGALSHEQSKHSEQPTGLRKGGTSPTRLAQ